MEHQIDRYRDYYTKPHKENVTTQGECNWRNSIRKLQNGYISDSKTGDKRALKMKIETHNKQKVRDDTIK